MATWLDSVRSKFADATAREDSVASNIRERLPLDAVEKVVFFKLDELTTDLICCEVEASGEVWFFHEEADGWKGLISYLEQLPGFRPEGIRRWSCLRSLQARPSPTPGHRTSSVDGSREGAGSGSHPPQLLSTQSRHS